MCPASAAWITFAGTFIDRPAALEVAGDGRDKGQRAEKPQHRPAQTWRPGPSMPEPWVR